MQDVNTMQSQQEAHTPWITNRAILTGNDLLFPYTHLVVDQAVLFHTITVLDKLRTHLLQKVVINKRLWSLWALACADHFLRHGLLLLESREPTGVELFPQL